MTEQIKFSVEDFDFNPLVSVEIYRDDAQSIDVAGSRDATSVLIKAYSRESEEYTNNTLISLVVIPNEAIHALIAQLQKHVL